MKSTAWRLLVAMILVVIPASIVPVVAGWLASIVWSNTDAWIYFLIGAFFGSMWAIQGLIGALACAAPGRTLVKLSFALVVLAVSDLVFRSAAWLDIEDAFVEWLHQYGMVATMTLLGFALASLSGLQLGLNLAAQPRRQLTLLQMLVMMALIAIAIRALQLDDDDGVGLLEFCWSSCLGCSLSTVLLLKWRTIPKAVHRWAWLIIACLLGPLSPVLHPEAEGERGLYILFGFSVWLTYWLVSACMIWALRAFLRTGHSPLSSNPRHPTVQAISAGLERLDTQCDEATNQPSHAGDD